MILDPLDVHRLCAGLKKSPEELLGSVLELGITDGNILPHLAMRGEQECCVFLNTEGRCSIHDIRPGFCRLFPLGRYYTEDGFKYILQIHEMCIRDSTRAQRTLMVNAITMEPRTIKGLRSSSLSPMFSPFCT